ncbi:hypothetical protein [Bifidobacterium mongoliense]|nr:hypothetical protein [Bifidobacterium mongoliense]MDY3125830.1 hypothetical protein [Bifidobacterium mongoliense]
MSQERLVKGREVNVSRGQRVERLSNVSRTSRGQKANASQVDE